MRGVTRVVVPFELLPRYVTPAATEAWISVGSVRAVFGAEAVELLFQPVTALLWNPVRDALALARGDHPATFSDAFGLFCLRGGWAAAPDVERAAIWRAYYMPQGPAGSWRLGGTRAVVIVPPGRRVTVALDGPPELLPDPLTFATPAGGLVVALRHVGERAQPGRGVFRVEGLDERADRLVPAHASPRTSRRSRSRRRAHSDGGARAGGPMFNSYLRRTAGGYVVALRRRYTIGPFVVDAWHGLGRDGDVLTRPTLAALLAAGLATFEARRAAKLAAREHAAALRAAGPPPGSRPL